MNNADTCRDNGFDELSPFIELILYYSVRQAQDRGLNWIISD